MTDSSSPRAKSNTESAEKNLEREDIIAKTQKELAQLKITLPASVG